METLRILSLWLHLLAVVVWVGGAVGWMMILVTVERSIAESPWMENFGRRVLTLGWEALGVIVITGLFNLLPRVQSGAFFEPAYRTPLLIKLGLVGAMIGIQLWQHARIVPHLGETGSWGQTRTYSVIATVLFGLLAAGVIWIGISLRFQ